MLFSLYTFLLKQEKEVEKSILASTEGTLEEKGGRQRKSTSECGVRCALLPSNDTKFKGKHQRCREGRKRFREWVILSLLEPTERSVPSRKRDCEVRRLRKANDLQTLSFRLPLDWLEGKWWWRRSPHRISLFSPFNLSSILFSPWMLFHPKIFESRGRRNFVITASSQSSSVSSSLFFRRFS